jgi:hypothetical protein
MACYMSEDYRLAQRAAWSVGWAARKKPELVLPYLGEIVTRMQQADASDATKRNAVRILAEVEIPKALQGETMNACFGFIEDPKTPPAIKAFSLTVLFHLAKTYPEIKPELKLLIESNIQHQTPAFKSRAKKILPHLISNT